jgi:hypothetical protein
MLIRLTRVLLLTSCFLCLIYLAEPPPGVYADGDPDEVIERGPKPTPEPPPPPGTPGEEFGDPDEVIEGPDPFAPPGSQSMCGDGPDTTFWLALETVQLTWLLMR